MNCTTHSCGRETSLYLCTSCIVELDALLKDVSPLVSMLDGPISMTAVTKGPGMGNGSGHPGSKPPINLDALLLKSWLCQLPMRAYSEATSNPNAGQTLDMARIWVKQARSLVWGEEAVTVDHAANEARIKEIAPAMPTRQLLPWLRKNARITITSMDIRNWVRRGYLKPVESGTVPTYHPHEALHAWHKRKDTLAN